MKMKNSNIMLELQFENPSLLILTAGETEFLYYQMIKTIGKGQLEPFTLTTIIQ